MFYIDTEKCNGCGACVEVCPQRAVDLIEEKAVINRRLCRECGNCLQVCAAGAVYEVVKEPQFVRVQRESKVSTQGKEVGDMPFGRGWFGWGGRSFGTGFGRGFGVGWGRGNPYPFCRFYPWLPRRWWAYGGRFTPAAPPGTYATYLRYGAQAPYLWW